MWEGWTGTTFYKTAFFDKILEFTFSLVKSDLWSKMKFLRFPEFLYCTQLLGIHVAGYGNAPQKPLILDHSFFNRVHSWCEGQEARMLEQTWEIQLAHGPLDRPPTAEKVFLCTQLCLLVCVVQSLCFGKPINWTTVKRLSVCSSKSVFANIVDNFRSGILMRNRFAPLHHGA